MNEPLCAVIGVVRSTLDPERTLYVKRAPTMQNYPGVWSLLSIQYKPTELTDPLHIPDVVTLFRKMTAERLNSTGVLVKQYLTGGSCADNPLNRRVFLHLYELAMPTLDERGQPFGDLNPEFYTEGAYLTPDEYRQRAAGQTCGLCMRLWSDYCVRHGLTVQPFAPPVPADS